jgi:hypothetical protein
MRYLLLKLKDNKGGLSFGGAANNSLRDTVNTINSGGTAAVAEPLDSVQFNKEGSLGGHANFRFIEGTGILVGEDVAVYFNSNAGAEDTYLKFNSANEYFELYVEGVIRAQF